MPQFQYIGTGLCRYGGHKVNSGEIIQVSYSPGKNFIPLGGNQLVQKLVDSPIIQCEHEISIIKSGLLRDADFSHLDYYKSIGPVLIQHWTCDRLVNVDTSGIEFVPIEMPKVPDGPDYIRRYYWQFRGIRETLARVRTPYVIRTRNDESFSDFHMMISVFALDMSRIVCSNVFWPVSNPTHIGDHVFIARTDLLREAYDLLCRLRLSEQFPSPELALFKAFCDARTDCHGVSTIISEVAGVVPIEEFGIYSVINHRDNNVTVRWNLDNPVDVHQLVVENSQLDVDIELPRDYPWNLNSTQ